MKVALVIHWFMLALVGGLAWHAGGSPLLLAVSMCAVLVYPLLGIIPVKLELFKPIICGLPVAFCALHGRDKPIMLWACLLALPQLLSALQCIRELQQSGTTKDAGSITIKRFSFTLGFYATMGLVFLLLQPDSFNIEPSAARMLAVVCSMLGLVAWETSRTKRLQEGKTAPLTDSGFLVRLALIGSAVLMFILLFTVALPITSDALCGLSLNLKSHQNPPDPKPREKRQSGGSDGSQSSDELSVAGPEEANQTGRVELPMQGTLELSDELRVVLQFENSVQAERLARQGPFYIRTLAVSRFDDGEWTRDGDSGQWQKDSTDGREDDKVEVGRHSTDDIAHDIYLLRSNGQALPALAGITAYALPEVFVLPDDCYQNPASGDIRYRAWSRPVNIQSLSRMNPEPGNPGPAYLTKLDTPMGARLTETAEGIGAGRTDLTGQLEALRQFFKSNFIYSRTVENKSNRPPLENFLFVEKKGYCDFFASASALLLRHMGIPSRVAYGYIGGEHDDATDSWIFREYHAHSWTEVFLEGQGWVICDFTPSSADSPSLGRTPPASLDLTNFEDAGGRGVRRNGKLWNRFESLLDLRSPWLPTILVLGCLAAFLVFFFRNHRTPELRATRIAARRRAKSEQQPDYLLEFLNMCQSFGHTRRSGQTLMEFHRDLKQVRFCHDDFNELIDYYYKSRYEDAPLNRSSERRFLKLIRTFRQDHAKKSAESPS